jgi:hypothetical protein
MPDNHLTDASFQRLGGQTPARWIGSTRDQSVRDVIGKAPTVALGVSRGQKITRLIAELAGQDPRFDSGVAPPARSATGGDELGLNSLPDRVLDDRWMLTGIGLILVPDALVCDR